MSLRRILHFAVAERPVFTICVDQVDPDILLSHMSLLVDLVSDPAEEFLLHVDRSPAKPGDLYDDEVTCIVQAYWNSSNALMRAASAPVSFDQSSSTSAPNSPTR